MPHRPQPTFDLGILIDLPGPMQEALWPEQTYAHLCTDRQETDPTVCLLPVNQIDLATMSGDAWWYNSRIDRWNRGRVTLPLILYNRIGRRRIEASRAGRRLVCRLAKRGHLFNCGFLDKAAVYQTLDAHGLSHLIPPYIVNPTAKEALNFFLRHCDIYLKPANGSLGRGIGRLQRIEKNKNLLRLNSVTSSTIEGQIVTNRELPALFSRLEKNPPGYGPYVMQATVPLISWNNSLVDLRALMQKDFSGDWRLTGVTGRAAPRDGITTHTVRGGDPVSLHTLVGESTTIVPTVAAVEKVCRTVAQTLAKRFKPLVELSFDLGKAQPNHPDPIVLEVNSKPFPFDEVDIRERARQRIMDYVKAYGNEHAGGPGATNRAVNDE